MNSASTGEAVPAAHDIPAMAYATAKNLYYLLFRALLHVRCSWTDLVHALGGSGGVAVPPALLRYKVSEDLDIGTFLKVGEKTASAIEKALDDAGFALSQMSPVLDFGCGCGRTMRWLVDRYPQTAFFGTDVDATSVGWCQKHLKASVCTNMSVPPLPFAGGIFDFVYAISVFTHLDEELQQAWLVEMHRVLRPGGVLLVTVHGAGAQQELNERDAGILRAQGLLVKRSSKLRGIHPEWYQTTFHAEEYVRRRFSGLFALRAYNQRGLGYQDLVILQRE